MEMEELPLIPFSALLIIEEGFCSTNFPVIGSIAIDKLRVAVN